MENRRIHWIQTEDGWIAYFCDSVRYRKVSDAEKRQYEAACKASPGDEVPGLPAAMLPEDVDRKPTIVREGLRITLNAANACNMNCGYCYANQGTYHSAERLMPRAVARRAIDLFVQKFGAIGSVKFIGGEPLLNEEVVCDTCDYVQEQVDAGRLAKLPDFIIATNGTLLDDRILEYSVRYHWRVGLSFDGPQEIHDLVRTFRDHSPTGELIRQNIRRWKAATGGACPSSINACYNGIHEQHGITVTEAVKYLKEELGMEKVNIVPVDASKDSSFALSDQDCFVRSIREILDPASADYRKYRFSKMKHMEKMLQGHCAMPAQICKAGITTFGISATGAISPCHLLTDEEKFGMGNVFDEDPLNSPAFIGIQRRLLEYNRYESEACRNCFANRVCIGCLGGNLFRCGDPMQADPVICTTIRGAVEEILRDITRTTQKEQVSDGDQ